MCCSTLNKCKQSLSYLGLPIKAAGFAGQCKSISTWDKVKEVIKDDRCYSYWGAKMSCYSANKEQQARNFKASSSR